jgi:hypothetical protein
MEKETAVDYIFRKLDVLCRLTPQTRVTGTSEEWENLYEKAKTMEKEQMIDFAAQVSYGIGVSKDEMRKVAEQYYKKTYDK